MKLLKKDNKGFTLTELIIVIVIIGILAAVLIPSLTGYVKDARASSDEQEAKAIYNIYKSYSIEVEENGYDKAFSVYYESITEKALDPNWVAYNGVKGNLHTFKGNPTVEYVFEHTSFFSYQANYYSIINAETGEVISGLDSLVPEWIPTA